MSSTKSTGEYVLNRSVGKMYLFGKDADFEAFQRVMIEAHPAAPDPHPVLLCLVQPLALRRLARRRRPGDGLLPLAGTHACDALEGRAPDRRVRSSVSGTVQSYPVQSDEHLLTVLRYRGIGRMLWEPGWSRGRSTGAGAACGRGGRESGTGPIVKLGGPADVRAISPGRGPLIPAHSFAATHRGNWPTLGNRRDSNLPATQSSARFAMLTGCIDILTGCIVLGSQ